MLRKRTLILLLVLVMFTSAQAQEVTEEAPLPTNTLVPSETPTETIAPTVIPTESPTATLIPTDTPVLLETPTQAAEVTTEAEVTPEITTAPEVTAEFTEVPLATEVTPTLTATVTETAIVTPTLLPETPLNLVYYENFNGSNYPFRDLRPIGALMRVGDNLTLRVTGENSPTLISPYRLSEVALQTAVLMNGGMAQLNVRQGANGAYTAVMDMNGQVMLFKSGQPLAAASITNFNAAQWHIVRLSATSSGIRVTVDGQEVIAVNDPAPLAAGFVSFGGDNLLVDDIQVWSGDVETASAMTFSLLDESSYALAEGETFTYNGEEIASQLPSAMVIYDTNGARYVADADTPIHASGPVHWSPDHTRIAYVCNIEAKLCVAEVDPITGAATKIQEFDINSEGQTVCGRSIEVSIVADMGGWSPDGDQVVAAIHAVDGISILGLSYLVTVTVSDGAESVIACHDIGSQIQIEAVTWAADNLIYYGAFGLVVGSGGGIYRMESDGSPQLHLPTSTLLADTGIERDLAMRDLDVQVVGSEVSLLTVVSGYTQDFSQFYRRALVYDNGLMSIESGDEVADSVAWSPREEDVLAYTIQTSDFNQFFIKTKGVSGLLNLDITPSEHFAGDFDWTLRNVDCTADSGGFWYANTVATYPDVTLEAENMQAVASETQLLVHEGPTLNARKVVLDPPISWGVEINPISRLEFDQGTSPSQVWYEIGDGAGVSLGWVAVRMEDKYYLQGTDADSDPCEGILSVPTAITFTYDRLAAARYAIAHSYRNSVPGHNFPTTNHVTIRLDSAIMIDGKPIPYVDEVPYANFPYSELTGEQGATGSADFVSQALWMGGFPMTYDVLDAEGTVVIQGCGAWLVYDIGGWRFCPEEGDPNGNNTKVWSNHQGIACYYAEAPADNRFLCTYNNPTPVNEYQNVVIPVEQHGHHIATFNLFNTAVVPSPLRNEVAEVIGSLRSAGGLVLDSNPNPFYERFINPNASDLTYHISNIETLQAGDYIFVERSFVGTKAQHGYLIAGWGQIMSCPSALSKIWTFEAPLDDQYRQLYLDFASAPTNAVPYVVDFPGSVDDTVEPFQTQRPRPRPFYCADYIDPNTNNYQLTNDGFAFFKFPNVITISTGKLYVSPNWHWQP